MHLSQKRSNFAFSLFVRMRYTAFSYLEEYEYKRFIIVGEGSLGLLVVRRRARFYGYCHGDG